MKKLLFLTLFLLTITPQFISSQEVKKVVARSSQTSYKSNSRHWSIAWNGGFCMLDGDFNSTQSSQVVPTSNPNFAFNAQLEYGITPIWGLFVQYSYLPWSGILNDKDAYFARGLFHDVTLNGSFNVINLFRSNRSEAFRWGLNVNVGAGIAFYDASSYYINDEKQPTELRNGDYIPGTNRTFVIPVGISLEYSPIEWLGIFLQAEYRMYQKDNLEGLVRGNSKDFLPYAGLGLRYKIAANKNRKHVRTTSIMDYHPDRTDISVITQERKLNDLSAQVDDMADLLNNSVVPRLTKLEENQEDITDSDLDGVPDSRDRHPNTPAGSFVNYYGEPLTAEEIAKILGAQYQNKPDASIYYETSSASVTEESEIALAEIASKLYNNPTYKLEVYGYSDYSGSEEYNMKLSIRRAETIKNILVKQYGIDGNRIAVYGKGRTKGPKDKFIANRRADVFIIK